jgi:hypothetical protein
MESMESNAKQIRNVNVARIMKGLGEMGALEIEDFNFKYNITKSMVNLSVVEQLYIKYVTDLNKKYVKVDENNNLMSDERGNLIFKSGEDKKNYSDAFAKLNETVVDVKVWTMKASDLEKIKGLRAVTMSKFHELIIDDIEPVPEEKK